MVFDFDCTEKNPLTYTQRKQSEHDQLPILKKYSPNSWAAWPVRHQYVSLKYHHHTPATWANCLMTFSVRMGALFSILSLNQKSLQWMPFMNNMTRAQTAASSLYCATSKPVASLTWVSVSKNRSHRWPTQGLRGAPPHPAPIVLFIEGRFHF